MKESDDARLVEAAREGDEEAFRSLVTRYEPRVAATVYGMLGQCPEAEDVGQETFIRFYRALDSFRGDSSVGTYITRIAVNLSLNELKRRKRRNLLFRSSRDGEMPDIPDDRTGRGGIEEREAIERALGRLSAEHRAVVVLRLVEGCSTGETAELLGIPVGTVLSRLSRAQRRLRKILVTERGVA